MRGRTTTEVRRKGAAVCLLAAPLLMLAGDALNVWAGMQRTWLVMFKLSFALFIGAALAAARLTDERAGVAGLLGAALAVVGRLAFAAIRGQCEIDGRFGRSRLCLGASSVDRTGSARPPRVRRQRELMADRDFDILSMGRSSIDLYANDIGAPFPEIKSFAAYVGGCPTNISVGTRRFSSSTSRRPRPSVSQRSSAGRITYWLRAVSRATRSSRGCASRSATPTARRSAMKSTTCAAIRPSNARSASTTG